VRQQLNPSHGNPGPAELRNCRYPAPKTLAPDSLNLRANLALAAGGPINLDHPGAGRVWLLIVLVSVFDFHVRFPFG
jgi:hypothetical protein